MVASNGARRMGWLAGMLVWPVCMVWLVLTPLALAEQSPVRPAIIVSDRVVTVFELEQRKLFLKLLRTPGHLDEQARRALTEDRLRLDAAAALKISVTDDDVIKGMEEFAQRAELSTEAFLKVLAEGGVEAQTFRDFVSAGLIWRQVVRTKFSSAATVTEAAIDQAMSPLCRPGARSCRAPLDH